MEHIDAKALTSRELNRKIVEVLGTTGEVLIENPHSMHNIATGLNASGSVTVNGSTGFYVGGFLEGTKVIVEGNTGWYAGDNMMAGELIIKLNSGCNAGTYMYGGTMVVYGGTGSRVGYAMKGGTIIVCGPAGRWAGQMTLGGKLVLLDKVGMEVGESMYKGSVFVKDPDVESKLGGNVWLDDTKPGERSELKELFDRYNINESPESLRVIRPSTTGRHTYVLFSPDTSTTSEHKALFLSRSKETD